jgi:hypothetical protein
VAIYSSITDYNQVQGLCGDDNDICEDDLMLRGGGLSNASYADDCYNGLHFDDFGLSWRVNDFENLFVCHFTAGSFCPDKLYYCACNITGSTLSYFGTLQEAIDHQRRCVRNDITADIFEKYSTDTCIKPVGLMHPTLSPVKPERGKRQAGDLARCDEMIQSDKVIQLCLDGGVLTDEEVKMTIQNCYADIEVARSEEYIPGHVYSLQQTCAEKATVDDANLALIKKVEGYICPGACNLRGRCIDGVCECDEPNSSADCSDQRPEDCEGCQPADRPIEGHPTA